MSSAQSYGSFALLRSLPSMLGTSQAEALGYARRRSRLGWWDPAQSVADARAAVLAEVNARVAQAQAAFDAARNAVTSAPGQLAAGVAQQLDDARKGLYQAYYDALRTGATNAADAIQALAARASDAFDTFTLGLGRGLQNMAQAGGDAFAAFWGFKPGQALGAGVGIAVLLALLGGGAWVYLMSTSGGQAYITSIGAGGGQALGTAPKVVGDVFTNTVPAIVKAFV